MRMDNLKRFVEPGTGAQVLEPWCACCYNLIHVFFFIVLRLAVPEVSITAPLAQQLLPSSCIFHHRKRPYFGRTGRS